MIHVIIVEELREIMNEDRVNLFPLSWWQLDFAKTFSLAK